MSAVAPGGNVTVGLGGGARRRTRTLLEVGLAGSLLALAAQLTGSRWAAVAAFLPSLALNFRAMKPKTSPQIAGTLILWGCWTVYGAAAVTAITFGRLHPSWGALFPCAAIVSIIVRRIPDVTDNALQRFLIRRVWDPPFLTALRICDGLGITLLHDGTGEYLSIIDDDICIAALPSASRLPALEAANVASVVNLCAEAEGPAREYTRRGMTQLRLPTLDTTSPSTKDLQRGVAFIREQLERHPGRRVLIHCKGGRGRAAAMATAWYVSRGMSIKEAVSFLQDKRPVTERGIASYGPLREFAAAYRT